MRPLAANRTARQSGLRVYMWPPQSAADPVMRVRQVLHASLTQKLTTVRGTMDTWREIPYRLAIDEVPLTPDPEVRRPTASWARPVSVSRTILESMALSAFVRTHLD